MTLPNYPLVNGKRYSFASIEMRVKGKLYIAIKEITYESEQDIGDVYGTNAKKIGRTRGVHKPTGSFSIYKEEWGDLATFLQAQSPGSGIHEIEIDQILVTYREGANIQSDTLVGARISKISDSHSQGTDALMTKCDLNLMDIVYFGGSSPVAAVAGLK